jgi:hypothetical protein
MAQVILFGGGDGGGILIGPNGVRPIPPFDPRVLRQLRAISALAGAAHELHAKDPVRRQLGPLVNKLTNLAVGQVEASVGALDNQHSLIYQDEDGGFTCGSTGKPPIPFPWPPTRFPSFGELVTSGVLGADLFDFIDAATKATISPAEFLERPAAVAEQLGVSLSERSAKGLEQIAPSRVGSIADPVDREVIQYFHRALESPDHSGRWASRPNEVSKELGIKLSSAALDRITAGAHSAILDPIGPRENPAVVVGVIVAVVIMLVPTEAGRAKLSVRDRSGVSKF